MEDDKTQKSEKPNETTNNLEQGLLQSLAPKPNPTVTPDTKISNIYNPLGMKFPSVTPTPSIEKSTLTHINWETLRLTAEFGNRLNELRSDKTKLLNEIRKLTSVAKIESTKFVELDELNKKLFSANNLGYLLSQVSADAHSSLLQPNSNLVADFNSEKIQKSFILAIDIRKSTDLMLNCKSSQLFSFFIKDLCDSLKEIIISNYGIFDKFTGDGILAFFPNFFNEYSSGLILKSAFECIMKFEEIYRKHRASFQIVLAETGLGIGIDYGEICIVNFNNYYTAIGAPVVYACRISSTKANTIAINQLAYNELNNEFNEQVLFNEIEIDIKNMGMVKAYCIEPQGDFQYHSTPEKFKV